MSQHVRSMMMHTRTSNRRNLALSVAAAAGLAATAFAGASESASQPSHQAKASDAPRVLALPSYDPGPSTSPVLSGHIVVHVSRFDALKSDLQILRSQHPDLQIERPLDADLGVYLLNAGSPEAAVAVKELLQSLPSVLYVQLDQAREEPRHVQLIRSHAEAGTLRSMGAAAGDAPGIMHDLRPVSADESTPRGLAVDPLFGSQWHFINGVNVQRDNNIPASVYTMRGLSGAGVRIGFTNVGLNSHIDTDHTELDTNYSLSLSMPFDPVLLPDSGAMTSHASIAVGEQDGVGVQGVAPGSRIATYNWPGASGAIPFQEYEAYKWRYRDLGIKVYNTTGYVDRPTQSYNPGALDSFVTTPLRNSYTFGRDRRGTVNIFSTGMNSFAPLDGSILIPKWPDPYNFPPANPGDSWSPLDELVNSGNEVSITLTNGWTSGPYYVNGQITNYAPANDRRSLVVNTIAEDGFADVYAAQGTSVFASFYGGTTNQFLSGSQAVSGLGVLTSVPGASNVGFFPAAAAASPTGNETMSGSMIAAGVIALMLEVNPSLSIRDIQHILFESIQESTKPASIKWPNFDINRAYLGIIPPPPVPGVRSFWQVNAGLYNGGMIENQAIRHSDIYGFGMVDAELAIEKAANWGGTPRLLRLDTGFVGSFNDPSIDSEAEVEIEIPDATFFVSVEPDGSVGLDGAADVVPGPFVPLPQFCVRQNVRIEAITLELTVEGAGAEDLAIVLESPNGTRSMLKLPATNNLAGTSFDTVIDDDFDANTDVNINGTNYALYRHTFLTWKHWGELSGGQWQVFFADFGPDEPNPEGEEPGTGMMPDPGADMVINLGAFGLPGSDFRSEKTVTGYRFQIFGTDSGQPIFEGCPPGQTSCPGDLNGDGIVDIYDLQIFISWYLAGNALADINEDGSIDFSDLILFRALWVPGFCDGDPNLGGRPVPGDRDIGGDNNPSTRPI